MKTSLLRIPFLATVLLSLLTAPTMVMASTPSLSLTLTPAGPGGTSTGTVALANVGDIESFTLSLDLSAGTLLTLPVSNRGPYLPSNFFGTALPQVELNTITASTAQTRVFFDGFKPYSTAKNTAGTVTFQVTPSAQIGAQQPITLTGEYLSMNPCTPYENYWNHRCTQMLKTQRFKMLSVFILSICGYQIHYERCTEMFDRYDVVV